MRADNKGEGGSLALLALINRTLGGKKRWTSGIIMLGVFATALFYGDSMITPAISVLSAVEGLTTVNAGFEPFVIPIAVVILVGLFAIQARGTAQGRTDVRAGDAVLFHDASRCLGVMHIMNDPAVILAMLNPLNALHFFTADFMRAFIALGSVVLAVTGAEALYADMGHFGRKPIRVSWLYFVLPALLLNYMGQGAMILSADAARSAREGQGSVLLSRAGHVSSAARPAGDGRDDHRQPGRDFGRVLRDAAGDPARLRAASAGSLTPAKPPQGRSTFR